MSKNSEPEIKNNTVRNGMSKTSAPRINTARNKSGKLFQTLASQNLAYTAIEIMSKSGKILNYWLNKDQAEGSRILRSKTLALPSTNHGETEDNLGAIPQQPSLQTLAPTNTKKCKLMNIQGQPLCQSYYKNEVNDGSIIMGTILQHLPLQTLAVSCTICFQTVETLEQLLMKSWLKNRPIRKKADWTTLESLGWTRELYIWPNYRLKKGTNANWLNLAQIIYNILKESSYGARWSDDLNPEDQVSKWLKKKDYRQLSPSISKKVPMEPDGLMI